MKKETEKAAALLKAIEEDPTSPQALQYRAERMRHVITAQTEAP